MILRVILCIVSVLIVDFQQSIAVAEERHGNWPQWRGPNRDNKSSDTDLLTEWPSAGPALRWSVTGIGQGIAAVAVEDGRIITLGDIDGEEYITALDERTGQRLWTTVIGPAVDQNPLMRLMRWLSQRTPTLDRDLLYAITADGQLVCMSTSDGMERWRKNYRTEFGSGRRVWGFCDYPLVDGPALICLPLGSKAGVVALNKRTGELLWQQPFEQERHPAYGAIIPADVAGTKQYIATLSDGIAGFSAKDGSKLWWHNPLRGGPMTHTAIVLNDGSIFCSLGYGGIISRLEPYQESASWHVRESFAQPVGLETFQDGAVAIKNYVYAGAARPKAITCTDWMKGEVVWTSSLPPPQNTNRVNGLGARLGLTYADGHLYCLRADGTVRLVEATPREYVEKGSFSIQDYRPGLGATLPVVTAGCLYVRDDDRLLCFDVRAESEQKVQPVPARIVLAKPERRPSTSERSSPKAIFVSTPQAVVDKMLEMAQVSKETIVVDLGSGDGRIVIAAAKKNLCRAVGYEIDLDLVRDSRDRVKAEGLSELVTIQNQDMFTADLSKADVVTVYLYPSLLEKMKPQFGRMKPGSRIVSHLFEIPGVEPSSRIIAESESGENHEILLYVTPLMNAKD